MQTHSVQPLYDMEEDAATHLLYKSKYETHTKMQIYKLCENLQYFIFSVDPVHFVQPVMAYSTTRKAGRNKMFLFNDLSLHFSYPYINF